MIIRFFLVLLALITAASTCFCRDHQNAYRTADASNLRQIGVASQIYAYHNEGQLPQARDVWDYAALVAIGGGLESAPLWQSKLDPATAGNSEQKDIISPFQVGQPSQVIPSFRQLVLSVAVPIGPLMKNVPSTTPVAWTRGLQLDGTWATHSPYGTLGGHIVFADGRVSFFQNLRASGEGELVAFGGAGKTSNILEALPPGTRIAEYVPSRKEQTRWKWNAFVFRLKTDVLPYVILGALWAPFVLISIHHFRTKRPFPFGVLVGTILISILYSAIL